MAGQAMYSASPGKPLRIRAACVCIKYTGRQACRRLSGSRLMLPEPIEYLAPGGRSNRLTEDLALKPQK